MADEEPEERRRPRARRKPDADTQAADAPEDAAHEPAGPDDGQAVPAAVAARRAAKQVAEFTGRSPECVISIDRADGGWKVGVEVLEIRRIPDTQDILAIYEVRVDRRGDLLSYRRARRYARGTLNGRCR